MRTIPVGAKLQSTVDVMTRLGRGKTWLHNRVKTDPTFPRPIYLSPREPQFFEHEIDAWLTKQAASRAQAGPEMEAAHASA